MTPLFVSFYTPSYAAEAAGLQASLEALGLDSDIRAVPTLGSWQSNTQFKATFLRDILATHPGPVVWLDADARVLRHPALFDRLGDCDFGAHWLRWPNRGDEMLSGTLYLGAGDTARELVERWCWRNEMNRDGINGDQQNLQDVVEASADLCVVRLPAEYTWIEAEGTGGDDISARAWGNREPVIVHRQASRRFRGSAG